VLVWSTQALPLPLVLLTAYGLFTAAPTASTRTVCEALLLVNASALLIRMMMLVALRESYVERGLAFWLSWLADIPAAIRLTISTMRTPRRWRGRSYAGLATGES